MTDQNALTNLKGIGIKTEQLFAKVGVENLQQLLHYYPRDYDLLEPPVSVDALVPDKKQAVRVVPAVRPEAKRTGNKSVTTLSVRGGRVRLIVKWFNMPYLSSTLFAGTAYVLRGKVKTKGNTLLMEQPEVHTAADYRKAEGSIRPVYGLTKGLTSRAIAKAVAALLSRQDLTQEYLDAQVRQTYHLCGITYALSQIHFPDNFTALSKARHRLAFDEFFLFMLLTARMEEKNQDTPPSCRLKKSPQTQQVTDTLPYHLTQAQCRVWKEIEEDLTGERLCRRLIQGDVGSGKTILAFLAMILAAANGRQSALMVPTEVLAVQHCEALSGLLEAAGLTQYKVVLLTGSDGVRRRRESLRAISDGEATMIIGTHALIQEKVAYAALSLVITDEQHRFGVAQRGALSTKGEDPHILIMSATPIPRTLAMILYGDLDISAVDELPATRLRIKNCVVDPSFREKAYRFIEKEVRLGRQAYVICPMVEPNEEIDAEDVTQYSEKLKKYYKGSVRVSMLHGQMKPERKNKIMEDFRAGSIDVLVSTTVVEVGVNVPNATVMMVEDAQRFGLAQLHQLRGRVGRGEAQSYCIFLHTDGRAKSRSRLDILNRTNDGFAVAEEDLHRRGPGERIGYHQSGTPQFEIADIIGDADTLKEAHQAARDLLDSDPALSAPEHRTIARRFEAYYTEHVSETAL